MEKVVWSKDGKYPMFAAGSNGGVYGATVTPYKDPVKIKEEDPDDEVIIDSYKVAPWFDPGNDFPNVTVKPYLRKSPVLGGAVRHKINVGVAQGLAAFKVTGVDEDGNDKVEPYFNAELHRFLQSRQIRRYLSQAFQNLYEYGNAFPQMITNAAGDKFATIKSIDAPWCRFTKKNSQGVIENCLVSAKWPDVTSKQDYEVVKVIDLEGTEAEIYARAKQLKNFIYPINFNTTGNIYYQLAPWDTARAGGHLDITLKIAEYLKFMFDNQMSIKYHIRIPYAYWDKKYPMEDYKSNEEKEARKKKIEDELDAFELNLTTAENAKKAIITHFEVNQQGKPEEKWEIEVLDDKFKSDMYLPQSAASNAEVLSAFNINPATFGLSLASGPYSNAGSGSDIREAFLIENALAWLDRQEVIDPVEMMARVNFNLGDDIILRTKSTLLTTLDTGGGTQKTVS
jgi:hypothetical protein